jgi:hypothetical protein
MSQGTLTAYGLSALASAVQGNYTPPLYLVIENNGSTLFSLVNLGDTTLETNARVDLTGDTQLVVGAGTTNEEVLPFSAVTGTGPYTYTLSSAATKSHAASDPICRLPLASDTMLQVQSEQQYDSVNDPGQRLKSVSGYASGSGQWTMQFFLTGIEASTFLMTIGLSDSPIIGQGNLHLHATYGKDHTYVQANGGVDLELDVPISLS